MQPAYVISSIARSAVVLKSCKPLKRQPDGLYSPCSIPVTIAYALWADILIVD